MSEMLQYGASRGHERLLTRLDDHSLERDEFEALDLVSVFCREGRDPEMEIQVDVLLDDLLRSAREVEHTAPRELRPAAFFAHEVWEG